MENLLKTARTRLTFCVLASVSLVAILTEKASAQLPSISSLSPNYGAPGDSILINGSGFNATPANNIVYFGATRGIVTAASTTALRVKIDTGANFNPLTVLNTAASKTALSNTRFITTFPHGYFIPGRINLKPKVDFSAGGSGHNPYIAAIGDIDGDGKPDLVVNNRGSGSSSGDVIIYRNVSTVGTINSSSFTSAYTTTFTGTTLPSNVKLADFDGDGKLDMVFSHQAAGKVSVFKNTSSPGSVSFSSVVDFNFGSIGTGPNVLAVADYDGDGWMDIAVSASASNNIVVLRNTGTPGTITSATFSSGVGFACGVYPIGIVAGDFDGDGKPDIAAVCSTSNIVSVLRNLCSPGSITTGSFAPHATFATGNVPVDLQTADIDGDGKLDLAVTNSSDTTLSILRNTSSGASFISFATRANFRTGLSPVGIALGDMDGDGKVDLAVTNPGTYPYSLSVMRNTSTTGSVSLASRDSFIGGGANYGVTIGDLDGDGYPDVVTANPYYFNTISILRGYPLPYVDTISASGPTTICHTGGTVALSNTVTGGTWISSNPSIATVSTSGVVGAVAPGTDTIFYRMVAGGDTNSASRVIIVEPTIVLGAITGSSSVCIGTTTTLADSIAGGTWSSSAPTVATISTSGDVTGRATGSTVISYAKTNTCGTTTVTRTITVTSTPSAGTITGGTGMCLGADTLTLHNATSGGSWTSSNPAVASINSSTGLVKARSIGATTISYSVTVTCGTAITSITFRVDSMLPVIARITGADSVCAGGASTTFADSVAGGIWNSSNPAVATVNPSTGLVTGRGVSGGSVTITYTVTNGCGSNDTTTALFVKPLPTAGSVTGPSAVCVGSTITVANTTSGGAWSSSNPSVASITSGGVVRGNAAGTATISYHVTNSCGAADSLKTITVTSLPTVNGITGPTSVCRGSTISLATTSTGGTWSSSNTAVASVSTSGSVFGVAVGAVNISYSIVNSCGRADSMHPVSVVLTPTAVTIAGPSTLCENDTVTYTGTISGGIWITSSASTVTIDNTGFATAIPAGSAILTYTVSNSCGTVRDTQAVTVNPAPFSGPVGGATTVCTGANTLLTIAVSGGTWSSSNTAIATVNTSGRVYGLTVGSVDISYMVTGSCGTATTVHAMSVMTIPSAGVISGPSAVCQGATTTLGESVTGGTWSSSATSTASITGAGLVYGVSPGSATISYTTTNSCGSSTTTRGMTVNPRANAGTPAGPSALCISGTGTYTSSASGGTWSTANAAVVSITSSGSAFGVALGSTTLSYTVTTTSCGTATVTVSVSVVTAPTAGGITGSTSVCPGDSITATATGSTPSRWVLSNGNALLGTTSGTTANIIGVSAGLDTLTYQVTNACGTATSSARVITILNPPVAGTIYGPASFCTFDTVQMADTTASATGIWYVTGGSAVIDFASGRLTSGTSGIARVTYVVSSASCGYDTARYNVTVRLSPYAGWVDGLHGTTGFDTVCVGSIDTLNNHGYGRYWASSNVSLATVSTAGVVYTSAAGHVDIYNIDTNSCGVDTFKFQLQINGAPYPGLITGTDTLCAGLSTTLSDTVIGGVWSSGTLSVATISSTGVVQALTAGTTIISYAVTGPCGSSFATRPFTVVGRPVLSSPLTANTCDSDAFTYVPNSASSPISYAWSRIMVTGVANGPGSGSGTIAERLDNTTNAPVVVNYKIVLNSGGCIDSANVAVTVNPYPVLMSPLTDSICSGALLVYKDTESTGPSTLADWSRAAVSGISPATNLGTHTISETLINGTTSTIFVNYVYILNFMGCKDTANVVVKVAPSPVHPQINTHPPSYLCTGTDYMNFGTSDTSAVVHYDWYASGVGSVWATGNTRKYCLVNFDGQGTSWVYLRASLPGSGCAGIDSFGVLVSEYTSQHPAVIYFAGDFICQDNTMDSYQWGYDDVLSLDSTILEGETNQNYTNASPDNTHKYYWVITKHNGCIQKSYYRTPATVLNVNSTAAAEMTIAPNPNEGSFKLTITTPLNEKATVTICNSLGQKIKEVVTNTNQLNEVTLHEAPGIYFITANTSTGKVSARIVVTK